MRFSRQAATKEVYSTCSLPVDPSHSHFFPPSELNAREAALRDKRTTKSKGPRSRVHNWSGCAHLPVSGVLGDLPTRGRGEGEGKKGCDEEEGGRGEEARTK